MESKKIDVPCKEMENICGVVFAAGTMAGTAGVLLKIIWLAVLGFLIGSVAISLVPAFHGKCYTNDEGVVLEMPFKEPRTIPYRDITCAYISLRSAGRSNGATQQIGLVHTMHIVTKREDISFTKSSGYMASVEELYDDVRRAAALERSPFAVIVNSIKEKCTLDPMSDYYYW